MTLLLHEKHELLHLVVNSIRKDLLDHNELYNCLALHAIANVGGREMGEALSGEVHRLLISPYGHSIRDFRRGSPLTFDQDIEGFRQEEGRTHSPSLISEIPPHSSTTVG